MKRNAPALALIAQEAITPPVAPAARGRLLNAQQVAAQLLDNTVSPAWVRKNVPGKLTLGHSTCRWFESDVQRYLDSLRDTSDITPQ